MWNLLLFTAARCIHIFQLTFFSFHSRRDKLEFAIHIFLFIHPMRNLGSWKLEQHEAPGNQFTRSDIKFSFNLEAHAVVTLRFEIKPHENALISGLVQGRGREG